MTYPQEGVDWRRHAMCTVDDDDILFPLSGESPRRGKALCRSCPVAATCLDTAMAEESRDGPRIGIRGGLTATERRRLARDQAGDET